MKRAIVTGVPGQDASYLCEYLIENNYEVYGVAKRSTRCNKNMDRCCSWPLASSYKEVTLDITDVSGVRNLVKQVQPDEYYNLAAQSHVGQSFKEPISTLNVDGMAVVGALEAIRFEKPDCKFYQACTSEMFGSNGYKVFDKDLQKYKLVQDELTSFCANSPYAAAKIYAYYMVKMYREAYNLYACSGILFNHESPRRGIEFVTRKITYNLAKIALGMSTHISMGNMEAYRDFGHAKDYVKAMHIMLQQNVPDDYVIATGVTVSINEIFDFVCDLAGLNRDDILKIDERFMRPLDVPCLCGDAVKAKTILKWSPSYTWQDMIAEMYNSDLELLQKEPSQYNFDVIVRN